MKNRQELYFSADVETDGPIPGVYSMLSFGVVALTKNGDELGTFEANLHTLPEAKQDPSTMEWWKKQPQAWATHRKNLRKPEEVMKAFLVWINETCDINYKPVMVCMPSGFDFLFLYWYMINFANYSPFSFSCVDMKSYFMGMKNKDYRESSKRNWPKRWFPKIPHTHVAVEDAREQGLTFINMMKENFEQIK